MRHFLRYILATALVVLGLSACKLEDTYYVQGVQDMVTATTATILTSDYGAQYTVTDDQTDKLWSQGKRYLIGFDIMNRAYDITLKSYQESTLATPVAATWEDRTPGSPVLVEGHSISGGYLNLMVSYYVPKNEESPIKVVLEYKDNPNQARLNFFLGLEGEAQIPTKEDDEAMKMVTVLYSFQLAELLPSGQYRHLYLTLDRLVQDKDGKFTQEEYTYPLYDEDITF